MDAVLKFDSPEFPSLVYTELVAQRLANAFGVPVAAGVPVFVGNRYAFASLMVASHANALTTLSPSRVAELCRTYPDEVAALVAFDLLIGNWDRSENAMAALGLAPLRMFVAFDHSHALLHVEADSAASIDRLARGDLIVQAHPFFRRVDRGRLMLWVSRIQALSKHMWEHCAGARPLPQVTEEISRALATALQHRARALPTLIEQHAERLLEAASRI